VWSNGREKIGDFFSAIAPHSCQKGFTQEGALQDFWDIFASLVKASE